MEKINFVNGEVKGVIGRDLVGARVTITDTLLQKEIESGDARSCWADIVEKIAYEKPQNIQEALDLLYANWKDVWLTDGLNYQRAGRKIEIGLDAVEHNKTTEGLIYWTLMTIEITE